MGLKINTNLAAQNTAKTIRRSTGALSKSMEKLSSGLRINRAADDAAGLAIAEGFRAQVKGDQVSRRGIQDGISLVQTADGALAESMAILQRLRELVLQAANGTLTDDNRLALHNEASEISKQLDAIAWDTQFNGISILSGYQTITLQTGANVSQTMTITLGAADSASIVPSGTIVRNLSTLANAVACLSTVDVVMKSITSLRNAMGAYQNRLEITMNALAIQEENASASESAIRDADIAMETMRLTRNQLLVSSGSSVLSQASVIPQTALQLLR